MKYNLENIAVSTLEEIKQYTVDYYEKYEYIIFNFLGRECCIIPKKYGIEKLKNADNDTIKRILVY